jgi:uncharacterized Zn finger protein
MRPSVLTEDLTEQIARYLREAFPTADITEFWVERLQVQEYRLVEENHTRYHLQVAGEFFDCHGDRVIERFETWNIARWLRSHPEACVRLGCDGPADCA